MSDALDKTDLQILARIQNDGRISNAKLAEGLCLSEAPSWRRWKRLEEEGYIEGYRAVLNRRKLGFGVLAFVQVKFDSHKAETAAQFEAAVLELPQVLACHNVTGSEDYLLQVLARDLDAFGLFTAQLRALPGVNTIQSSLSLREIKGGGAIPLRAE